VIEEELPPPVQLEPFTVEHLGKRGGLLALEVRVGRHALRIFVTSGGESARVSAEIDGKKLTRRKKLRPYVHWSSRLDVQRWIVWAAAEFDGPAPSWSCQEIARNARRARVAHMSHESVRRLIWKLSPGLAKRRNPTGA